MLLSSFYQELKLAFHSLKRVPGFVLTVIATLGITLGTLITIFNLNHLLLVKDLPFPDAEKIMVLDHVIHVDGQDQTGSQTIAGMQHWYKHQTSLKSMALVVRNWEILASHQDQPKLSVRYVTPEYFQLLATPMLQGRSFSNDEGKGSGKQVAVLSHRAWQQWFNGRTDVIGQTLQIGDNSFKVVGVAAESFHAPQLTDIETEDIWLSWDANPYIDSGWGMFMSSVKAIGILADGVSKAQAESDLGEILDAGYQASEDKFAGETLTSKLVSIKEAVIGDTNSIALMLMAGTLTLLFIAVANVTNLFLSRAAEKQRTLAIQASLGARPMQLFTALFAESFLLCMASTILGLLIAGWGFVLLKQVGEGELPRLSELGLDAITLGFSLMVGLLLALIFARLSRAVVNFNDLKEQLQSSGKGSGLQISKKTRNALVITQVALASILLVASAVVMEEAIGIINKPLGFNSNDLYTLRVDAGSRYEERKEQYALSRELKRALQSLPQVESVSRTISAPIREGRMRIALNDENMQRVGSFRISLVDHNYFEMLQLPMIQGRGFAPISDDDNATEFVVSESLAKQLAPDGEILGKMFTHDPDAPFKVVGVVSDYFNPGDRVDGNEIRYYMPYFPVQGGFQIKLSKGGSLSVQEVLALIQSIDPQLRINELTKVEDAHQALLFTQVATAGLTLLLTLLALLLAGAGIYGVLSYSTQMRRYELGIHMALGAKTGFVKRMIMRESLVPVFIGLATGLSTAVMIYALARTELDALIQPNLTALLIAFPMMLTAASLACYLPVRKVIVDDPVKALRNE